MESAGQFADGEGLNAREYKRKKDMNYWTLGMSFLVSL
jgi:hypothetical protein